MTHVTVLECLHDCDIDFDPLQDLYSTLGATRADQAISTTLEDLAHRLADLQASRARDGFEYLPRQALRMATIARRIGLTEVTTAARHVADCARQRDGIAVEATLARLERGFDLAIGQVWTLRSQ